MSSLKEVCSGLPVDPLPSPKDRDPFTPHAPARKLVLTEDERKQALRNALRYFPSSCHLILAPEFAKELTECGHIYMYRFRPDIAMRAYPIDEYPAKCKQAAAIMHMLMNNLDPRVAQFPHELVTYGGNGQVLSNWAQFWILMHYLSMMTDEQTLVMCSGHPQGLFPSTSLAPRMVITNGLMIPNYSSREIYDKLFAMGVTMYGQMTAGSYAYIGPQGIVHGTALTVLNAGRKYLGLENLRGKIFVTSGLGGMSGAQAKSAVICGCIGVIAEVNKEAIQKRYDQGWVMEFTDNLDVCVAKMRAARDESKTVSIGYHGNIVDLWERLADELDETGELLADLASDQTSLHNPYGGGYWPVGYTMEEATCILENDAIKFKNLVQESLCRQVAAINRLTSRGMHFWDYGNAFLLEASRAGADVMVEGAARAFRYPSYVQDIMGEIFSGGFGPFRWVCTSGLCTDLETTDRIATDILEEMISQGVPSYVKQQYEDNCRWIKEAGKHNLVVGSQARILYSDMQGRIAITNAFNKAIRDGTLQGPVVISRDHHDVSGADSPYRETANITDGSKFCADMAVQTVIGDSFRGATWVALHNGGGVGWGEVINGGFGLVLDGSQEAGDRAQMMLSWDVSNGVCRRAWAGSLTAETTIRRAMEQNPLLTVTLGNHVDDESLLDEVL
ncbi:urocanate hydratase-like isoform X2 [Corticium candelabrum]|uniref:urocanate hydratase-like isoform X2 n=1 Tax=Corticium candelabrum TaxID=121492 RepID=UPI002E254B96|nr:urocanate hydratase-like isoform X2 [Corticium candelabrum]